MRLEMRRVLPLGPLTPNRGYRVVESAADILDRMLAEGEGEGEARSAAAGTAPLPCATLYHEAGMDRVVRLLSGRPDFPVTCYQFQAHPRATTVRLLEPLKALEVFGVMASRSPNRQSSACPFTSIPV